MITGKSVWAYPLLNQSVHECENKQGVSSLMGGGGGGGEFSLLMVRRPDSPKHRPLDK